MTEQGIRRGDAVCSVVKVNESFPFFNGGLDVRLRPARVALLGEHDGAQTGHQAAAVFRMVLEIVFDQRRGILSSAELNECPRRVSMPERRGVIRRDPLDAPVSLFVFPLAKLRLTQPPPPPPLARAHPAGPPP